MATQEIALRSTSAVAPVSNVTEVQRIGGLLAASGYFSEAREMAQAAVKVMAGQELGIPPVAAMMGIFFIKGKVALGGNLIASRIRAHGYDYRHKQFDAKGCVLVFFGKPDAAGKRETLGESSFTEEDAKTAGVFSDMYRKYPRNMYFNRAISNGAKWFTPEVFAGAPVYTPEELGAKVDENGDMVHEEPTPREAFEKVKSIMAPPLAERLDEQIAAIDQPKPKTKPGAKLIDVMQAFGALKRRYEAIGQVSAYYSVLGSHGVEKSNEFQDTPDGIKAARAAYKEMSLDIQDREVRATKQPEITDADLPASMFGEAAPNPYDAEGR